MGYKGKESLESQVSWALEWRYTVLEGAVGGPGVTFFQILHFS